MSREPLLIERLVQDCRDNPFISLEASAEVVLRADLDVVLIPAFRFLDPGFPRKQTVYRLCSLSCLLLCFGPADLLPGCFLAGCEDYLKDPWEAEELEWRVRKLCRVRQRRLRLSWGEITLSRMELRSAGGSCPLSAQEQSILLLLTTHSGEPVSREALYYGIWGKPPSRGSRAVDMHIASLRKKLKRLFPDIRDPIRSIRGVGYLISE